MRRRKAMHRFARRTMTLGLVLLGPVILSCEDSPTDVEGAATLRILLTDAPSDYIGEAYVDIGEVVVIPTGDGPHITLSEDGTDGEVDLLDLQNAATMILAEGIVEPGTYKQLRLIVESARVVLAGEGEDQYEFKSGGSEQELVIPSGAQSGIKLNLSPADKDGNNGGFDITPGETVLVLDFDVNRSFVIQGNPETPAGINGVHFQPTIRVAVQDGAGGVSGTVSTALLDVSVEGLVVTAEPVAESGESETYQTQAATTATGADGSYTLPFLVPGEYTVSVAPPAGHASNPATVTVEVAPAAAVTGVNFAIILASGS
jgi:hypothetical protein